MGAETVRTPQSLTESCNEGECMCAPLSKPRGFVKPGVAGHILESEGTKGIAEPTLSLQFSF